MFCNKCGKQLPEGSAFCPKCGAPVVNEPEEDTAEVATIAEPTPENNDARPTSEGSKDEDTKSRLPVIIVAVLIVFAVIFIAISANRKNQGLDINAESVAITELYNPSLGIGLRLGMTKTVVDQKLGAPQPSGDDYLYKDTYLYVSYVGGKLAHMYISWPNDRWVTKKGAAMGITADELQRLLGQPNSIQHDGKWWYYYSSGNKVTGFEIIRDSVMSIYIYDATLISE